jgi:hypothetical protein
VSDVRYAIEFTYPGGSTDYAGARKGALDWAATLQTAIIFETAEEAARVLKNGYGQPLLSIGKVIEVLMPERLAVIPKEQVA